jgi:serine protease Do
MSNRGLSFVSLLAVIGLSIIFGMVVGGRLNTPRTALAAPPQTALQLAPAATSRAGATNFADVVEQSIPAVVRVTSSRVRGSGEDEARGRGDDLWRFFFGPDEREQAPNDRQHPRRIGEGSGFVIAADGYILTNNHVVEDADRIEVALQDGREFQAEVVGTDPNIDLALLKIEVGNGEQLPSLPLGDSEELRVGEWVIAIGNPLEYEHTVTVGVLSAKQRRVPLPNTDQGVVTFLQTDAAINLGNSGGPLLDSNGNVVGINTAIRRVNLAEGIGFALPINHARGVIEQLRERGYVKRGMIGITMNPNGIDEAMAEYHGLPDTQGVLVEAIAEGGPAADAGLRRFDVIRKVDDSVVRNNTDLIAKVASRQPGDTVKLEVLRGNRSRTFNVVLGDREELLQEVTRDTRRRPQEDEEDTESGGLGITVENLTPTMRERLGLGRSARGVLVTDVEYGSAAADTGLNPGSLITSINDADVRNIRDWDEVMRQLEPGEVVMLAGTDVRGTAFSVYLRVPGD